MSWSFDLGVLGEETARLYLQACGYRCLDCRYRRPEGEIDLVVQRANVVVFVEVKTRGPGALAPPEAWVDARKLRRLRRTARSWIAAHPQHPADVYRFDVVAVRFGGSQEGLRLRHFEAVG